MKYFMLVVAALLLTELPNTAAAAEFPEHKSKNAQKVLAVLNSLGMNDPQIKEFVDALDSHIEDRHYMLAQTKAPGGRIALRYAMQSGISTRNIELAYSLRDTHIECVGSTQGVMINYHLNFH